MNLVCAKCGLNFSMTWTGRNKFSINTGDQPIYCVRIKERLAEHGKTDNFDCEYMDNAVRAGMNAGR